MAIWSAEAYISDMFDVTGIAAIMTLIQRSPEWVVCMRPGMVRLSVSTGASRVEYTGLKHNIRGLNQLVD